ncbi:MAG TPA: TMEM165/GDT1 family protein [Egibacteraceae bacterium]|nr:TMEM165/GDT1 family protein [Egibacteraceae bacterium]
MEDFALAYGVALVAELGDKSQLAAASFGARHRVLPVLLGFTLGAAAALGLGVLLGAAVGELLAPEARSVVAGTLFLAFAAWSLRSDDRDEQASAAVRARVVFAGVALAVFVAEMGDKTQFATAALAARQAALPTWLGATLGEVTASGAAILVGAWLGPRMPERALRIGGAVVFAAVGIAMLADGLVG